VFDHNTRGGIYDSIGGDNVQKPILNHCIFYHNGYFGAGYQAGSTNTGVLLIENCSFIGNGTAGSYPGLDISQYSGNIAIVRSLFVNNAAYGIKTNSLSALIHVHFLNCATYGNGTAAIDANDGALWGQGNITEDPAFTSTTSNAEDYTPTNANYKREYVFMADPKGTYSSPGEYNDYIGAVQPASASGGRPEMRAAR
jgi:hypothetical protein